MSEKEGTGPVVSATRIVVRPEKRKELFLTISSLLHSIRRQEGCRAYRFYGEAGEEDSFMLIGEWESRTDWDRHLNSEHFTILLGSFGILSQGEDIDFKLLSPVAGIEALNAPRP